MGNPGLFYTVWGFTLLVSRFCSGFLGDRYGRTKVILPALSSGTLAFFLLAGAESQITMLLAGAIAGFALGSVQVSIMSIIIDNTPSTSRGSAMATYTLAWDVGAVIGGIMLGFIVNITSYSSGFYLVGVLPIVGITLYIFGVQKSQLKIDRDYYIGLGHIQKNSNWNPKYSSETQGIQPMSREEFNDIIDKKQTGGMYDQMRQYQQGGMQLPGGEMNPIPGSDAVEFTGASHDEGGIMLDPQTEVEDGETMDQVTVAKHGGKRGDYFFSSYLKKGGRSFADMHKDILRNGGDQQEIDWLAKMQEKAAGRDAKKVGKAKLGGMMKYQSGGEAAGPAYVYTTSDATRDYNQYLKDMQFNPSDPDYDATGILNFEDWSEQQGLVHQGPTETRDFAAEDEAARKAQFESDLDLYDKALKRDVPLGAYVAGATQLVPAAYSLLHKQPAAEQTEFTPGFTHPIVAERGKASKLQRVNYNVERARNAADMRAINKYIETSGGGPANIINKMMAYSKKQEGDAKIAAAETRANTAIANQEAQMAQQMELSNLQRAQQAATTNAQLAAQEAARADQVEELNARRRQQRIDDMEYMKYQGIDATAQGIAGIIGDALSYKAQEKLAKVIGPEGVYDRAKAIDIFLKEINPATGKLYTREQAADKVRDIYNYYNPKEDKDES